MEAFIQNYNVAVREMGSDDFTMLSFEGSEGNTYTNRSIVWSPDSKKIAVFRVVPGYAREVHLVESSPDDQVQPKHSTMLYAKPGDVLDKEIPVILDVASGRQVIVDDALFPNAYTLSDASRLQWREDSRHMVFEYNQRGHQVYRVIEVDAETGATRAVISEEAETFVDYSNKIFRRDIDDGREIIWMSERDGWNHLYLYDGTTGQVKNQITRGNWVVRGVDSVDVANRQIWFRASGMNRNQDPYFIHYYRINFDGTGLVTYTRADGSHTVTYSPDRQFYVDQWSRVDLPPVAELRRTADQSLVMELERADASALLATGWTFPEVVVAKGRDGVTDIWGIIIRPTNFDPNRKYPVIESIYAGPHGSFAPKTFSTQGSRQAMAWASSWPRWTVWAPTTGPGPSTTWRGGTSGTRGSRTGSSGIMPWAGSTTGTTPPGWASTGPPPADRTPWGPSSSTPSSTTSPCRPPDATTTGWTKSGGTRRGWVGPSGPTTPHPPTWTTPIVWRASFCSS